MSKIKVLAILVVLIIVIATAPLFAGCRKITEDTQFVDDATENILISINDKDYASFSKDFEDSMKAELIKDAFPDFAFAINGSNGNYNAGSKKLVSVTVKEDEELISASYLADFDNFEDVTFEVTFKEMGNEKKVVGLWLMGPSTNLFIGITSNNF